MLAPFGVSRCEQQSTPRDTISRIGWDIGKDRVCTKKSEVRFTVKFTVKRRGGGMVKEERIAVGGVYGMAVLSHTTDQHGGGRLG